MSYARFAEDCGNGKTSDVYLFGSSYAPVECCGCILHAGGSVHMFSAASALAHIRLHVASGHNVPSRAKKHFTEMAREERLAEIESRTRFGKIFSERWVRNAPARKRREDYWRRRWDKSAAKAQERGSK